MYKLKNNVLKIFIFISVIMLSFSCTTQKKNDLLSTGQKQISKKVFILCSFNPSLNSTATRVKGIKDAFSGSLFKIDTVEFYLDLKTASMTEEYYSSCKSMIKTGYGNFKFDAVMAVDNEAFEFLRTCRDELFPGLPLVFVSISDYNVSFLDNRHDLTGTAEYPDFIGTISIALKVQPAARKIVVITDNSPTGMAHYNGIKKIENEFKSFAFEYLFTSDYTMTEVFEKVAKIQKDSVIILIQSGRDKSGTSFPINETTSKITGIASVPCFVISETRFGTGAVGGSLVSWYYHGQTAAKMVISVFNGKKIEEIPVKTDKVCQYMFDYNALKRFNINESILPADSKIINKPESFFIKYKIIVIFLLTIFILLILIIALLFIENVQRRINERIIGESEARYRDLAQQSQALICEIDKDARFIFVNPAYKDILGYDPEDLIGRTAFEIGNPQHYDMASQRFVSNLENEKHQINEWNFVDKNGKWHWMRCFSNTYYNSKNEKRINVVSFDITDQKNAEEKIRNALAEKELLLKELYHRTKNNMQVIISLMELTNMKLSNDTVKEALKSIKRKILSMALVHEMLYQSKDLSRINIKEYIDKLVDNICNDFVFSTKDVSIIHEIQNMNLELDIAVPCGLVLSELLSNSYKYAFKEKNKGEIKIGFFKKDNIFHIKYSDNGVGVKEDFDYHNSNSLGLSIINAIVTQQLSGEIKIFSSNGFNCEIMFDGSSFEKKRI
jgi:PAS domain S-box-containing protein